MKNSILNFIESTHNKASEVINAQGELIRIEDMIDDVFYCINRNSILSEQNMTAWKNYVMKFAPLTDIVKPVAPKTADKKLNKTEQKNLLESYCMMKFDIDINKSKKLEDLVVEVEGYFVADGSTEDEAKALVAEAIN